MNENRIKETLEAQGRTKTWLADQLGVHQTTIHKYCANQMHPDIFKLKLISEILGVTMEELTTR